MTNQELKIEQAAFKTWYIPRLCGNCSYRITACELSSGLRFAVERDGKLEEIWRKEGTEYLMVL